MNIDDSSIVRARWNEHIANLEAPHVLMRPKIFKDGNAWCALYGDNIQEGICGFGNTPANAANAFDAAWYGWDNKARK